MSKKLIGVINLIQSATTIKELDQIINTSVYQFASDVKFGIEKIDRISIAKIRKQANEQAQKIISRLTSDPDSLTEQDKNDLRKYTGNGGIGGSTNEYYTPQWVASGAWDALKAYGIKPSNVLEPSAGVGVFSATKPDGCIMTAVELDKTSSAINQALHPDDAVINSPFELFASNPDNGEYDCVIGNPPYGSRDKSMINDAEYKDIKLADQYFTQRSIDKVRAGGFVCLVVPSRIVEAKSLTKWRQKISLQAEFLGAHRLPTGTFGNNGSDSVVTDVVIFRKHTQPCLDMIAATGDIDLLKESNVLWDSFINGKWYKTALGKKCIHGTENTIGKGKFKRKIVDRGSITNEQIQKALANKFDSRINWSLLNVIADSIEDLNPKNGDFRVINGIMRQYKNDEWIDAVSRSIDGLDSNKYGVSSEDEATLLTSNVDMILSLPFEQSISLYTDLRGECGKIFNEAMSAIKDVPPARKERVFRAILIGSKVQAISELVANTDGSEEQSEFITEQRKSVGDLVFNEYEKFGDPSKLKSTNINSTTLKSLNAFVASVNKDGEVSDLLNGSLKKESTIDFNYSNPRDCLAAFYKQRQLKAVFIDELKATWTDAPSLTDDQLIEYLSKQDGIAINSDGSISQMHHATSGDIVQKLATLQKILANSDNEIIASNISKQIESINERRKFTAITDIKFKMTDNYIPNEIILEFLHERGYNHFTYAKIVTDDDGNESFVEPYSGNDGFFTGYRMRDGNPRKNKDEAFEQQLESYLNKVAVRGGSGNAGKAALREQIRQLDDDFTTWIATSNHADELESEFNNIFNGYIEPEYDDSSLELNNISGTIELMDFQNSTIRRHSDDGCGIIGFGTGLGKTFTALGLGQYNIQTGRSNRICYVVPKSVLENWYNESHTFFGENNLSDKVFIGVKPVLDKNGNKTLENVLDDKGKVKKGKNGQPIQKIKLDVDTSDKAISHQLNNIAQSKAKFIFMTKDVYGRIPLKESTIADNVEEMVANGLLAGSDKYAQVAEKHREKEKNNKFEAKYADDGLAKKDSLPNFESLLIDTVIVDEGHDFRNSYKTGSYGNRLAFLPSGTSAGRAVDMQVKNNYLKRQNNGRGCYMLSATPTVNSPIDAFNMLSHVVPPDVFAKMGIVDCDDFIRIFGRTGETSVHKLSGKVETKEALLGFQNLDALRSLFHRYVSVKTVEDVNQSVHVPDQVKQTTYVDMSDEQKELYETLRQRADALSNPDSEEALEIAEEYPDDTVFGLMRDMDKVCTDLDLYHGVITYLFKASEFSKVQSLADDLPGTITVRRSIPNKDGVNESKKIKVPTHIEITKQNKTTQLVVTAELDNEVISRLNKFGLNKFTHPVTPKYAAFLEKARDVYLSGGKHLVFSEEKTQHIKIARMISQYVGCSMSEIGIINSDAVAGKKGSRANDDDLDSGLEAIASAYNSGKYRFIVLNKKGEVGVNLHVGTTDISHLTLPFTPASLTQRNGRGCRVGSSQKKVNIHYYAGKGSFDRFRIATIERKAKWIDELFNGDENSVDNGDADNANENMIMLSPDPEEARRRVELNNQLQKEKLENEYRRIAAINVNNYLKAMADSVADRDQLTTKIDTLRTAFDAATTELNNKKQDLKESIEKGYSSSWVRDRVKDVEKELFNAKHNYLEAQSQLLRLDKAKESIKRFSPLVKRAIKDGYIDASSDIFERPDLYFASRGKVARIGGTYIGNVDINSWSDEQRKVTFNVREFNRKKGTVNGIVLVTESGLTKGQKVTCKIENILRAADIDQDEAELTSRCLSGVKVAEVTGFLDRQTFERMIKERSLKSFSDASNFLIEKDNQFVITGYQVKEDEIPFIVYPDLADDALKLRLTKFASDYISEQGSTPRLGDWIEIYLGKFWKEILQESGNKASQSEIVKFFTDKISAFEKLNLDDLKEALLSNRTDSFYNNVRQHLLHATMPNITNRDQEYNEKKLILNNYHSEIKQRSLDAIKRESDALYARYIKLLDQNQPERLERLRSIVELSNKYKSDSHFIKNTLEVYQNDVVDLYADMTAVKLIEQLQDGSYLRDGQSWRIESDLNRKRYNLSTLLDELSPVEMVPCSSDQQAKVNNAIAIEIPELTQLANVGIIAKTNTIKLTKTFKRKTTTFEPYSMICLQDTNGIKGKLIKAKNRLKSDFNAQYGVDLSDEFQGSWWLVPANCDANQLLQNII
ncbi:SNF2-related protein [Photobacterium toruni]|uniref:SNF2-related protein n=1 Tax=Photobacterium toruni TaxID=1935446 RepID=A0ABU6L9Z3_9GAMM|nr:SNF2-related protein [Photobacterium toruni]